MMKEGREEKKNDKQIVMFDVKQKRQKLENSKWENRKSKQAKGRNNTHNKTPHLIRDKKAITPLLSLVYEKIDYSIHGSSLFIKSGDLRKTKANIHVG